MKLLNLELNNFQSFEELKIDFSKFKIISIIGRYKDNEKRSNGSGKSSIFDGIIYCLYGKSRTKKDKDLIQENKTEMSCTLLFELGKDKIEIIRGITEKSGYLNFFINGKDETDKKLGTQDKINSKIGMDFDLFTATTFFQQEQSDKFTSATPLERKNYLKNLLKLDVYDRVNDVIKKKVKTLEDKSSELKGKLEYLKGFLDDYDIDKLEKQLEKDEKELAILQNETKVIEKNIKIQQDIDNKLGILKSKKDKSKKLINKYEEEIKEKEIELVNLNKKNVFEFSEITKKDLQKIIEEKDVKVDELSTINSKLSKIKTIIEINKTNKKTLIDKDNCPLCKKELEFNYKNKLFSSIDMEISKNIVIEEKLNKEIIELQKDITRLKNDYGKKESLYEFDRVKITQRDKLVQTIDNIKNILDNVRTELKIEKKDSMVIIEQIEKLKEEIPKEIDMEKYNKMIEKEEDYIIEVTSLKKDVSNYKKSKKEYKVTKKEQDELNWKLNCYNIMKGIFGKNGITAYIIKESIDEIEYEANNILKELNDGEYEVIFETLKEKKDGDFTDTFDILIRNDRAVRLYESYSGGQRAIINFSIRMALSRILSKLNKVAFGFIGLDEIFGELDEYNKEKMIGVINLLKKTFNQIFVISHDYIKESFQNSILIEYSKKTGKSKVKEIV